MQLETIEQNNQILNNLGSLDGKMDSVSSRVDSIGFGVQSVQEKVQDILEQQDSHNKKVRLLLALACVRSIAIGPDRMALLRLSVTDPGRGRASARCQAGGQDGAAQARTRRSRRRAVIVRWPFR